MAEKLATAKAELKAVETELSSLELRILLKGQDALRKFLKDARKSLQDIDIPADLSLRVRPMPERIPEWMGKADEHIPVAIQQSMEFHNNLWKEAQKRLKDGNKVVGQGLAQSLSSSFIGAFTAGEDGFANMIKQWGVMLLESAVFSLLMSLFNPGKSFGSFFSSALGFQHGTTFVPETGLAIVHRGEAIVPASQNFSNTTNRNVNSGSNSSVTFNISIPGVTNPLAFARQLEDLTRRRLTRFALER